MADEPSTGQQQPDLSLTLRMPISETTPIGEHFRREELLQLDAFAGGPDLSGRKIQQQETAGESATGDVAAGDQGFLQQAGEFISQALLGQDLATTQKDIVTGELSRKIGLKAADPVGSVLAEALTRHAIAQGLPEEQAQGYGALGAMAFGGMRKFPGGINTAKVAASAGVKRALKGINAALESSGVLSRATRGTVSQAETIAGAAGRKAEELLALSPERIDEVTLGLRNLTAAAGTDTARLVAQAAKGDAKAIADLPGAVAVHGTVDLHRAAWQAETARGLAAFKIMAEGGEGLSPEQADAIGSLVRQHMPANVLAAMSPAKAQETLSQSAMALEQAIVAEFGSVQGFAQIVAALPTQAARGSFLGNLWRHFQAGLGLSWWDLWYGELLSGPVTHVANALATAATLAVAPLTRTAGVALGAGTIHPAEPLMLVWGAVMGARQALIAAGKTAWTGESPFRATKMSGMGTREGLQVLSTPLSLSTTNPLTVAADYLGKLVGTTVRLPGIALSAADSFFQTMAYQAELHAQALREAGVLGAGGSGGLPTRMARLVKTPPLEVAVRSEQFALWHTLNAEMGSWGQSAQNLVDNTPLGRVVVAFLRVSLNSLTWTFDHSPGLALLTSRTRADLAAGGARASEAWGRQAAGAVAGMVAASYAMEPIRADAPPWLTKITGTGPRKPEMRAALQEMKWQPCAIWTGKEYVGLNRMDPLGGFLCLAATAAEVMGHIPDESSRMQAAAAVTTAGSRWVIERNWLRDFGRALDMAKGDPGAVESFFKGMARSVVPGVVRWKKNQMDPVQRDADTYLDLVKGNIPGYSEDLPVDLTTFGQARFAPPGWAPEWLSWAAPLSPLPSGKVDLDSQLGRVISETIRNGTPLPKPVDVLVGPEAPAIPGVDPTGAPGVPLTAQQKSDLTQAVNAVQIDGKTLVEALDELQRSEQYQKDLSPGVGGSRHLVMMRVYRAYHKLGQQALFEKYPELQREVEMRMGQRRELMAPAGQRTLPPIPGGGTANPVPNSLQQLLGTLGR